MRVSIEFDLKEGQSMPDPRDIARLTDLDWHADWWHISDIQDNSDEDISDDIARNVLYLMAKYSDCNVGINWDSIGVWTDWAIEQAEEVRS
jgi:hypothetical protein